MKLNVENLEKLARGLMTVPQKQFDMAAYQRVFDGNLLAEHHPDLAKKEAEERGIPVAEMCGYRFDFLSPAFVIEHNCGTSGCALGWAPSLVAPGRPSELWDDYSERVFGVCLRSELWSYMFSEEWEGDQNSPIATAGRIMHVVQNGKPPEDWYFGDAVIYPIFTETEKPIV